MEGKSNAQKTNAETEPDLAVRILRHVSQHFYLMFLAYNRLFYLTDVLQLSTGVSALGKLTVCVGKCSDHDTGRRDCR